MSTPLTPDFYTYPWTPIEAVRLEGDWVHVRWADGTGLPCYSRWLYENVETIGFEVRSRESIVEPSAMPVADCVRVAQLTEDGALAIDWVDGTHSVIHPGWLRHVGDKRHLADSYTPPFTPWTAATMPEPLTHDGAAVLTDPSVLRSWLRDMTEYGFARLRNTPADPDFLAGLAALIGPIRDTNFGHVWSVKAVVNPDSTANTGLALGQHADLPTRETPPGFQFLHCIANTVPGGASRMTDGIAVATELATNHAEAYDALTTLPWVFFNRSPTCDHRWEGPAIDLGGPGQPPITMRTFYPVRAFPAMEPKDVPRAYESLKAFSQVAHDPRFQITYPFEVGDLVGFDNRRMLHGRDAFDPGVGERHLRGTYIDHDDLFSTLRVLERHHEAATRSTKDTIQ